MSIGKNLTTLRVNMRLSQEDLAEKLMVSRQAVSKWELDQSKPDWNNLIKISRFFSVTVDDLLDNKIVEREAFSINPLKRNTKTSDFFRIARLVIIVLFIAFIIILIYKFTTLFIITSKTNQYKELNNYHYIIYSYVNGNIIEKEECWFKDGISKTIKSLYSNEIKTTEICIDYNNQEGYRCDEPSNNKSEVNIKEYIEYNKGYENGGQLYSRFPEMIQNSKIIDFLMSNTYVTIKKINQNVVIVTDKYIIKLENNNWIPIINYVLDEDEGSLKTVIYEIELNSVENIKI